MAPSVTLKDVARFAGVSLATASRALRDDPVTPPATRERVKTAAREIGYRPDPSLSLLIERRWHGRRSREGLNIAYIYNGQAHEAEVVRKMFRVYGRMAEDMGYVLIDKDLAAFKDCPRLIRQLRAQGCAGLLFANLPGVPYLIDELTATFPAVSIGVSAYQPACPLVLHDEFLGICHTWDRLVQRGYRRIGPLLASYADSVSFDLRLGAVLCRQQRLPDPSDRVPIFFLKEGVLDRDALTDWFQQHRPDTIMAHHHLVADVLDRLPTDTGRPIPHATSNLWDPAYRGRVAGYFRGDFPVLERALTLLNLMIRSSSTGASHASLVEMVDGEWVDGDSLPVTAPSGHMLPR